MLVVDAGVCPEGESRDHRVIRLFSRGWEDCFVCLLWMKSGMWRNNGGQQATYVSALRKGARLLLRTAVWIVGVVAALIAVFLVYWNVEMRHPDWFGRKDPNVYLTVLNTGSHRIRVDDLRFGDEQINGSAIIEKTMTPKSFWSRYYINSYAIATDRIESVVVIKYTDVDIGDESEFKFIADKRPLYSCAFNIEINNSGVWFSGCVRSFRTYNDLR